MFLKINNMTNSELYRELYELKEEQKDKFENISREQFLYNINYLLERKYYGYDMNNENFCNLVKDSLENKSNDDYLFSLSNTDSDYDIKLDIRNLISDKKLKLEKYREGQKRLLYAKKMKFIVLIFFSILAILWVFLIFLKNRSEIKELIFGGLFSGFIIFGIYHFLGFIDAISKFFTKKPLFAMDKDDYIDILSYNKYFKTHKLTELTNVYYIIINNLLYYYDELDLNKKCENDDDDDGIYSAESPNNILNNESLKLQLDSLPEVNWKFVLDLIDLLVYR